MNIAHQIASHAAVRHVVLGPFVFRLRRITSADLIAAGYTEVVGIGSAAEALRQVQLDQAAERRRDPVKAAAAREHEEEIEQSRRRSALEQELSTEEGARRWIARLHAYIVASVDGCGELLASAEVPSSPRLGRYLVLPADADLRSYASTVEPFRFVLGAQDESPDGSPPSLWVERLDLVQRQALGLAAIALQDVAAEVSPFRRGSGSADDAAPAG